MSIMANESDNSYRARVIKDGAIQYFKKFGRAGVLPEEGSYDQQAGDIYNTSGKIRERVAGITVDHKGQATTYTLIERVPGILGKREVTMTVQVDPSGSPHDLQAMSRRGETTTIVDLDSRRGAKLVDRALKQTSQRLAA